MHWSEYTAENSQTKEKQNETKRTCHETINHRLLRSLFLTQVGRMINYLNEDELYRDNECLSCIDHQNTLDLAKEQLQEVISILFGYETFDKVTLENKLDHLCGTAKWSTRCTRI